MKQIDGIVIVVIAVTMASLSFAFWCGEDYGSRVKLPPDPVVDLRTIGSACTIESEVDLGNGEYFKRWEDQGELCAGIFLSPGRYDGEFRTAFPGGVHDATFLHRDDAVQWVESQPYRQGGAK